MASNIQKQYFEDKLVYCERIVLKSLISCLYTSKEYMVGKQRRERGKDHFFGYGKKKQRDKEEQNINLCLKFP